MRSVIEMVVGRLISDRAIDKKKIHYLWTEQRSTGLNLI